MLILVAAHIIIPNYLRVLLRISKYKKKQSSYQLTKKHDLLLHLHQLNLFSATKTKVLLSIKNPTKYQIISIPTIIDG